MSLKLAWVMPKARPTRLGSAQASWCLCFPGLGIS